MNFNELFINLVRERPILYEMTKKAYKDTNSKENAWKEISEETKLTGLNL